MVIKKALPLFAIMGILMACNKPQAFVFRSIDQIEIQPLSKDSVNVKVDLEFSNPNGFAVNLKKVVGTVLLNGDWVGEYHLDTLMKIDKKSEFTIPTALRISKSVLYKNALNSLFQKSVELQVKGYCKVGKSGIFIHVPFDYKGQQHLPL